MAINNPAELHEQIICANVFIKKDGKYLVLRRSAQKRYAPGVVHPVGGKVDIGENPYTAAVREVGEETGLIVKDMQLEAVIQEIEPVLGEPHNWLIFHFSAEYDSGEMIETEEGELIWLTAEEIRNEQLFPSVKAVVDHILNEEKGTVFTTLEYDADKKNIVKQVVDSCARA